MFILQTPPAPPPAVHHWSSQQWGTVAQWVGAVLTAVAIWVAIFKEEILRRFRNPELKARLVADHPDCGKTPINHEGWIGSRYFLRLWIQNDGNARAEDVEVFLLHAWVERKKDVFEEMPGFTRMNLRWSYSDFAKPMIHVDGISPRMGRYCDFVAISDPAHPVLKVLPEPSKTRIAIQYEFLGPAANWPLPARYKFEILIAANNSNPVPYVIDFRLTGYWSENEADMFQGGFFVNVKKG